MISRDIEQAQRDTCVTIWIHILKGERLCLIHSTLWNVVIMYFGQVINNNIDVEFEIELFLQTDGNCTSSILANIDFVLHLTLANFY